MEASCGAEYQRRNWILTRMSKWWASPRWLHNGSCRTPTICSAVAYTRASRAPSPSTHLVPHLLLLAFPPLFCSRLLVRPHHHKLRIKKHTQVHGTLQEKGGRRVGTRSCVLLRIKRGRQAGEFAPTTGPTVQETTDVDVVPTVREMGRWFDSVVKSAEEEEEVGRAHTLPGCSLPHDTAPLPSTWASAGQQFPDTQKYSPLDTKPPTPTPSLPPNYSYYAESFAPTQLTIPPRPSLSLFHSLYLTTDDRKRPVQEKGVKKTKQNKEQGEGKMMTGAARQSVQQVGCGRADVTGPGWDSAGSHESACDTSNQTAALPAPDPRHGSRPLRAFYSFF